MTIKRRFLLWLIVFLALAGLALIFILWSQIQNLKGQIEERRLSLSDAEQTSQRSSELINLSSQVKDKLTLLNSRLISNSNALSFITALEGAAAERHVNLEITRFDPPITGQSSGQLTLIIQGNFISLLDYLHFLEVSPYLLSFQALTISPAVKSAPESSESSSLLSMTLSINTHWTSGANQNN